VEGLLAAHCVTTLHYLAPQAGGQSFGEECVVAVLTVFGVAPVEETTLRVALSMEWPDFEDAVCAAAAVEAGCQAIVTRDRRGFAGSALPVLSVAGAVEAIQSGG